jgi:hypothetical protein
MKNIYHSIVRQCVCVCKRERKPIKAGIHPDRRLLYRLYKRDSTNASLLCRLKYLSGEREDVYSFYSVSQNVSTCQRVTMVTETTEILIGCEAFHDFIHIYSKMIETIFLITLRIKIYVCVIMYTFIKMIIIIK